jgi:hypothetical protein
VTGRLSLTLHNVYVTRSSLLKFSTRCLCANREGGKS